MRHGVNIILAVFPFIRVARNSKLSCFHRTIGEIVHGKHRIKQRIEPGNDWYSRILQHVLKRILLMLEDLNQLMLDSLDEFSKGFLRIQAGADGKRVDK
ncbi:hypothetical protein D3C77_362180 [compost metagenome]